jgi:hypothetical protein
LQVKKYGRKRSVLAAFDDGDQRGGGEDGEVVELGG